MPQHARYVPDKQCCIVQLQHLMLQMAASAAAPPARPSRTAETNTSMLWAPSAPLLPSQSSLLPPTEVNIDSQQTQQLHQTADTQDDKQTAQDLQGNDKRHQPEAQQENQPGTQQAQLFAQRAERIAQQEHQQAQQPVPAGQASTSSASAAVPVGNGHSEADETRNGDEQLLHSSQQHAQQASHHDARQPWTSRWTQPALPSIAVPAQPAVLASQTGHQQQPQQYQQQQQQQQQHRRVTASAVPSRLMLQQHAARQGSGLQAARSLSWGHSAQDQALASLRSSGKAYKQKHMRQLQYASTTVETAAWYLPSIILHLKYMLDLCLY